jgi:aldehyde dehydrogenase
MPVARVRKIKVGNPLDPATMMGPQISQDQMISILNYVRIGRVEGAQCLTGGAPAELPGDLAKGHFLQPTVSPATIKCASSRRRSSVRLSQWLPSRRSTKRSLSATILLRPWRGRLVAQHQQLRSRGPRHHCYHVYLAGAAFGGYKESGFGRETDMQMLNTTNRPSTY